MRRVAIIPARGGSKRIPGKNTRSFLGRPIITWPIEAALSSGVIDRVVVSTDDPAIADVAEAAGAEVPFLRSSDLSDDHTGITEVVRDAIDRLSDAGARLDAVCLIYATAPLARSDDIRRGLYALTDGEASFAISVTPFPAPVQRALKIEDGRVRMMDETNLLVRSQDLIPAYHDAGQFCWGSAEAWQGEARVFIAPTAAVVIPNTRVQDIDTEEDWARAEAIARLVGLDGG